MATIVTRAGKGSPLTNAEVDSNFTNLDTEVGAKLDLAGGALSGALAMGANRVTGVGDPIADKDAANKEYVDVTVGLNASLSNSAYLGAKASAPTVDNNNAALTAGALYFDTSKNLMQVYSGSSWGNVATSVYGAATRTVLTAGSGQTVFSAAYDVGYIDVFLNGVKLVSGVDFTATNGTTIVLALPAVLDDLLDVVAFSYVQQTIDLSTKQDTLVSGQNIKTINGQSVLGSGNLTATDAASLQGVPIELVSLQVNNTLAYNGSKFVNRAQELLTDGGNF